MLIACLCLHMFHSWLSHAWPVPHVIIPRVAQDELHQTCVFNAMRKRGPRSHVMGLFKYLSCCHACNNEVIIERYRNPLEWWKTENSKFPNLANLAKKYLCICGTGVPLERVFSSAGHIANNLRNRLTLDNVNKLVFLSKNLN